MHQRRTDALAVLTLLILASLFFADVLLGIHNFYFRDLIRYYYPAKQVLRDVVLHGEFPYWNRYFAAGQPLAANPEHEVFYPLTWLILLPSYDLSFRLLILVHVAIALGAMYALLRSMEVRPSAAWFGAISWGLGGVILSTINLLPILFSAAWLPLTCLYARRFLQQKRARDFALASLFLGLQFLVGEPTTVIQTGLLLGVYAMSRGRSPKPLLWIAAISTAAFAVGAAQMLPALDHVGDSVRSRPFDFDLVSTWSMPWAKLGELVYPTLLAHDAAAYYPRTGGPFLASIYAGLLVIALAVAGAFVRPRGARLVLVLCALSTVLALGAHTPLLGWLYRAGIGTSLRYPEKFALLGVFTLTVFAARMFDRLIDGDRRLRTIALVFLIATTAIAATIGIAAVIRGVVAIVLVATAKNRRAWILATAAFVAADLAYTLEDVNPRMPRRFFDPPPIAAALPPNRDAYRLFHEADWYPKDQPQIAGYFPPGPHHYWSVRNAMLPMLPAAARIQTVLQADPDRTELLPTHELTTAMREAQRIPGWEETFMAMSNAWFRTAWRDFDAERQRTGGDFTRMKPVRFLAAAAPYPRYYFADGMIAIRERKDFVGYLLAHRVSPRVAFVEGEAFAASPGVVRSVTETANTATIDVDSTGRGFLVMSVTRHKYWQVDVDGQRVAPVPTNLAYQGIAVPPGRHRVTMRYRNPRVLLGLAVSGIAIALLVCGGFWFNPRAWRTAAQTKSPSPP